MQLENHLAATWLEEQHNLGWCCCSFMLTFSTSNSANLSLAFGHCNTAVPTQDTSLNHPSSTVPHASTVTSTVISVGWPQPDLLSMLLVSAWYTCAKLCVFCGRWLVACSSFAVNSEMCCLIISAVQLCCYSLRLNATKACVNPFCFCLNDCSVTHCIFPFCNCSDIPSHYTTIYCLLCRKLKSYCRAKWGWNISVILPHTVAWAWVFGQVGCRTVIESVWVPLNLRPIHKLSLYSITSLSSLQD